MNLSVTFIDLVVVLVVLTSMGYAIWRGFLWETLTIFAWGTAAFATLYFGPWLVPLARGMVTTYWMAALIAYAGVFLVVFIPLSFMRHRFSESVKHSPIGPLDRAMGAAFGILRGLVIIGISYLAFTYFVPIRQQPNWLTQARFLPLMQSTGEVLLSLVPDQDRDGFATATTAPAKQDNDQLGALIRQTDTSRPARVPKKPAPVNVEKASSDAPKTAEKTADSNAKKAYGADDRRALDRLMETTGGNSGR